MIRFESSGEQPSVTPPPVPSSARRTSSAPEAASPTFPPATAFSKRDDDTPSPPADEPLPPMTAALSYDAMRAPHAAADQPRERALSPDARERGPVQDARERGPIQDARVLDFATGTASAARLHERTLVIAAQTGDATAFAGLVRLHQQRAYSVARAIAATHEDAEDAVQEGFLHAYKALDRFRPEQPFGAWLHRIVANAALDLARRRKVRAADELSDTVASPFHDPAEALDLRERLTAALSTLGERQRAVIVLHDVEGFKHAEIGRLLGIPEGTARSDLHHARAQLRRVLGDIRSDL